MRRTGYVDASVLSNCNAGRNIHSSSAEVCRVDDVAIGVELGDENVRGGIIDDKNVRPRNLNLPHDVLRQPASLRTDRRIGLEPVPARDDAEPRRVSIHHWLVRIGCDLCRCGGKSLYPSLPAIRALEEACLRTNI